MVERGTNAPSPALSSNSFSSSVTACCPSIFLSSRWRARRRVFYTHQSEIISPPRNLINPIIGSFCSWLLRTVQRFPRLGSNQITISALLLQSQLPVCVSPTFFSPLPFYFVCVQSSCVPLSISSLGKSPLRMRLWSHFSNHSRVIVNTLYTQASNHIAGSLCILLSTP